MTFSERLKQLRTERKLTQEMLSKESGLTKSSIAMYETGKRKPKIEVLERLADFFNVDLDYLVGKSDRTTVIAPPAPQKSDGLSERDRTANGGPAHASAREMHQLEKILAEPNLTYNGVAIGAEDIEKINRALELAFWDAKEKNKRKK